MYEILGCRQRKYGMLMNTDRRAYRYLRQRKNGILRNADICVDGGRRYTEDLIIPTNVEMEIGDI